MIVLASASPRRKMLLEGAGYALRVEAADIVEKRVDGEEPAAYVERMAREKAAAVGADGLIVAADTVVVHRGEVLGKPGSVDRAREMLHSLRGDVHSVFTGVCVREGKTGEFHLLAASRKEIL